jgi:hypothetical protein
MEVGDSVLSTAALGCGLVLCRGLVCVGLVLWGCILRSISRGSSEEGTAGSEPGTEGSGQHWQVQQVMRLRLLPRGSRSEAARQAVAAYRCVQREPSERQLLQKASRLWHPATHRVGEEQCLKV